MIVSTDTLREIKFQKVVAQIPKYCATENERKKFLRYYRLKMLMTQYVTSAG
jgi:hypothetical protein